MGRLASRLPRYPVGTTGVTDVINLEDDEKINLGTGKDARVYYDGTDLKIEPANVGSGKADFGGHISLPADNRRIYLGASDDVYIYFDATYLRLDSSAHEMLIKLSEANKTTIYGGITSGDDLTFRANSVDSYPEFFLGGNSYVTLVLPTGQNFNINEAATAFCIFNRSGSTFTVDPATGNAFSLSWTETSTTGNIVGLNIDASTNLTMGTDLGATGLKINVKAPDGSGRSQGIDLSSLAVDFPVFKVVADAVNTPGAMIGQVAIDVGGTTYYLYYYETGTTA